MGKGTAYFEKKKHTCTELFFFYMPQVKKSPQKIMKLSKTTNKEKMK